MKHSVHPRSAQLLSATELLKHIDNQGEESLSIIDVRGRVEKGATAADGFQDFRYISDDDAYFGGHIPGAAFIDWRKVNIAEHRVLCDTLSAVGVQKQKRVCVYDWGDMIFATRLWWALLAMGCTDVAVLNGGWRAWMHIDARASVETLCPLKVYSDFESPYEHGQVPHETVSLREMLSIVESDSNDNVIIDARSLTQYTGAERRAQRSGHIPGALNVPYRRLLREDGLGFLSDEALADVLMDASVDVHSAQNYFAYCNGGVSSTAVLFCLLRCASQPLHVRNYCGSFNEWGNRTDTPLTTT